MSSGPDDLGVPRSYGNIASGMLRGRTGAAAVNPRHLGVVVWTGLAEAAVGCLGLQEMGFWTVLRVRRVLVGGFLPPGPCTSYRVHWRPEVVAEQAERRACPESPSTLEHC